ncbi:class I glutamine amidotransferase-like protein [Pholiota molesta]|nr:class I glutamine amidotransferase-like protein [Pholiota molesta]
MAPHTIHFGLLLLPKYQWLDAAGPVDFFYSHTQESMRALNLDEATIAKAPIIEWHYISHDFTPVQATSGPAGIPTNTYADCPALDYLLIPGNDLLHPLPEGCAEFLYKLMAHDGFKALLTVCTGSMAIAPTGILDGLRVCSNKYALKMAVNAGNLYKKIEWVGDRRWHVDGKVWSSAGITAGIDLAAEFARVHFDPVVVEYAKIIAEYQPKPAKPDVFAFVLDGVDLS